MRRALTLLAMSGVVGAAAVPAVGLTAKVEGSAVVLDAGALEANTIQVDVLSNRVVEIRELDPNGPKLFGLGLACDRQGTPAERDRRLQCTGDAISRLVIDLGPRDDRLRVFGDPIPVFATGGPGRDDLAGNGGDDRLDGGGIIGPGGEDRLNGLGGDDVLANTGPGATSLIALGGPGDDQILGGEGSDELDGEDGNDVLRGGGGFDELLGGPGDDDLRGGDGDDDIGLGPGRDVAQGGQGADSIEAVDAEVDTVNCDDDLHTGSGPNDIAVLDLADRLQGGSGSPTGVKAGGCALVVRAPVGLHPTVRLVPASLRIGASLRVRLACPAALRAPCAGTLRAEALRGAGRRERAIGVGRRAYSVGSGGSRIVTIALTARERRILAAAPRVGLTAVEPGNEIGPKTTRLVRETPGA